MFLDKHHLAGYLLVAVLMAGIGAATSSVRGGSEFSAIVAIPSVIALYSSPVIVNSLNGAYSQVLSYIPFAAAVTMMLRPGTGDVPLAQVAASLSITMVTGLALLWLSARVFRAGLLLYVQRMSPRAIWRAIGQSG